MTSGLEAMSDAPAQPAALARTRPFYWSVRREIWEHPAVWVAPLVAGGVGVLGFLFSAFALPRTVRALAAGSSRHAEMIQGPYSFVALAVMVFGLLVALFYCLAALNGERRDRSIQFWKSLPVSDLTTVLSKAAVPLAVLPATVFAVTFAAQVFMLVWSTLVVILNGLDPTVLWRHVGLGTMWVVLPYGLVVNALWLAPVYGWFLLVSAWAKRMTVVWALAPLLAISLFERLAFGSAHFMQLLGYRLMGGFAEAYSKGGQGRAAVESVADLDPVRTLLGAPLLGGLLFAALCLAGCVWLRRRNEPI